MMSIVMMITSKGIHEVHLLLMMLIMLIVVIDMSDITLFIFTCLIIIKYIKKNSHMKTKIDKI